MLYILTCVYVGGYMLSLYVFLVVEMISRSKGNESESFFAIFTAALFWPLAVFMIAYIFLTDDY